MKSMLLIALLLGVTTLQCEELGYAKVLKLRGTVIAHEKDQKPMRLKIGSEIPEMTSVETYRGSFVRFKLADGSIVNVAPGSEMVINRLPDNSRPGFISLVKGKLRASVTKKSDGKEKMYIRTKTAAMGVRGTDFQVVYNPANEITNTITYQGEVAMVQTKGLVTLSDIPRAMQAKEVVPIKRGQFSMVNPKMTSRTTIATRMNPAQFHALKRKEVFSTKSLGRRSSKKTSSIVPPGMNTKKFVKRAELAKSVAVSLEGPPPEGYTKGDKIAPPAGGFIDTKTGHYIAPPPGSPFNPDTQTYEPVGRGGFDKDGGPYIPDPKHEIKDEGLVPKVAGKPGEYNHKPIPTFDPKGPSPSETTSMGPPVNGPPPPSDFLPPIDPDDPPIDPDEVLPDFKPPLGRVRFHMTVS